MNNFAGIVQAGLQVGLSSILIRPKRGLYNIRSQQGKVTTLWPDILAQATIEERHTDDLEVTEHPVEQGAMISDHAYKRPAEVVLRLGWSNSPPARGGILNPLVGAAVANSPALTSIADAVNIVQGVQTALSGAGVDQVQAIYQTLLQLQESRALFTVYTGKRVYTNMVCKSLATETDYKSANSLPITMTCKQVILVNTRTVSLPASTQKTPALTASPVNKGSQNVIPQKIDIKAQIRAEMAAKLKAEGKPVPPSWNIP